MMRMKIRATTKRTPTKQSTSLPILTICKTRFSARLLCMFTPPHPWNLPRRSATAEMASWAAEAGCATILPNRTSRSPAFLHEDDGWGGVTITTTAMPGIRRSAYTTSIATQRDTSTWTARREGAMPAAGGAGSRAGWAPTLTTPRALEETGTIVIRRRLRWTGTFRGIVGTTATAAATTTTTAARPSRWTIPATPCAIRTPPHPIIPSTTRTDWICTTIPK
mmetsp:Transcript_4420/g.11182  ORF Transcript_4420/g.11182 Transcript_4420/m.11182 type:complete len:222 (+) Transcript_4420:303-968(+)